MSAALDGSRTLMFSGSTARSGFLKEKKNQKQNEEKSELTDKVLVFLRLRRKGVVLRREVSYQKNSRSSANFIDFCEGQSRLQTCRNGPALDSRQVTSKFRSRIHSQD